MREGTEQPPRTVAGLLNVVTLGTLVYLRMELLFCASVTITAAVARVTVGGLSPLLPVLHVGTRRAAVLVLARGATFILREARGDCLLLINYDINARTRSNNKLQNFFFL